jgi:type IV pilus assembly protein PilA
MYRRLSFRQESGFTIVELMVVVLVIGVLIAIGLPVFLGAKTRSQERAAQAQLRTALIGGLTYWSEGATFTGFDQGCSSSSDTCLVADATEASIAWVGPGQPGISQVSVVYAGGNSLLLVAPSGTGSYFCVAQSTGETDRGRAGSFSDLDSVTECAGGW